MEQNPLKKQDTKRDEAIKEQITKFLNEIFSSGDVNGKINEIIRQLEVLPDMELPFNKIEIISGLKESLNIKEKDKFISYLLKIIEPLFILRVDNPKFFEKLQREAIINNEKDKNIRLSEFTYFRFHENGISIHLAPAREFLKEKGVKAFINDVQTGLKNLASIIKDKKDIKKVTATSWIVNEHPGLMETLGFTVDDKEIDPPPESLDKRKKRESWMLLEDFLAKYGENNQD